MTYKSRDIHKPMLSLPSDDDALISAAMLPNYIPLAAQTFNRWRSERIGPPFIKLGKRTVAYRAGDIRAWIKAQKQAGS